MPRPLKPGEIVYIERDVKENYSMPSMQAATDHYNIGFIVSGDRKWISTDCIRTGHAGDVGIAKPGVFHKNCAISGTPYDRYIIKISNKSFEPVIDITGASEFDKMCSNYLHFTKESRAYIQDYLDEMLNEYNKKTPASQLVLQGMVHKLFFYIRDNHIPSDEDVNNVYLNFFDERINSALSYIENNLNTNLSLNSTAASVALSPSHFSRLFKSVTGTSYTDYITIARLERAKILLELGEKNLNEIAEVVGISNGNYLCALFKKIYGKKPSDFK